MALYRIHFFTSFVHEQGTYFRSHNLAAGLARLGQDVTVFGCDVAIGARERTEVREGVHYVIVPESWKASVFSEFNHPLTAIRRYLRSYPPCDISHLFQPFLGAALAWRRCPARVRFYDWDDQWTGGLMNGPAGSWRQWWPRFVVRKLEDRLPAQANQVTAVSEYLAEFARQRHAKSVSLLYNGYWPAPFADRTTARQRVGLRPDALYVGFMGRTVRELDWCFAGLQDCAVAFPQLRLALSGAPASVLSGLAPSVRERIDYLGDIATSATRDLAAGVDLGLLPLEDNPFNRSRFPIKFCEHLATGNPLLYSEIGECARLAKAFPWALPAGTTRSSWLSAFGSVVGQLARGDRPNVNLNQLADELSWLNLAQKLLDLYRSVLGSHQSKYSDLDDKFRSETATGREESIERRS